MILDEIIYNPLNEKVLTKDDGFHVTSHISKKINQTTKVCDMLEFRIFESNPGGVPELDP